MVHIRAYKNVIFAPDEKPKIVQKKIDEDCEYCKLIGVGTFTVLGGYLAYLRMNTPKNGVAQRNFLAVFSTVLFGAAIYRAVEFDD